MTAKIYSTVILTFIFAFSTLNSQVQLKLKNDKSSSRTFSTDNSNFNVRVVDSVINVDKTEECEIYLKNRSYLKDVSIVGYSANSIKIDKKGVGRLIKIDEINKMKFKGSVGFWGGAAIGAGIAMAGWLIAGIAAGSDESMPYALMFGLASIVPAGLIGGLVAVLTGSNEIIYDFSGANPDAKMKRLKHIMKKHVYWTPMP